MTRTGRTLVTLVMLEACSSSSPEPAAPPAPPVVADAGIDGITAIGAYDPASGAHLDDDGSSAPTVRPKATRAGRPIEVTLRSSPPGADAYVDGVKLGPTPAFWQGEANGRDHEFAFTMKAHATARYRFVPVASGVVHARLEPVVNDPAVVPTLPRPAPHAIQPPAPPTTVVSPPAPPTTVVSPPAPVSPPDAAPPRPDAAPVLAPDAAPVPPDATGSAAPQ